MFWGISFCVGNKSIEVNGQEFSLGELTAECLNISVDDYTAMRKVGRQAAQYIDVYEATNNMRKAQRRTDIDRVIDRIRAKYGYFSIRRAITLLDPALDLDAKGDHTIHPVGFLGTL